MSNEARDQRRAAREGGGGEKEMFTVSGELNEPLHDLPYFNLTSFKHVLILDLMTKFSCGFPQGKDRGEFQEANQADRLFWDQIPAVFSVHCSLSFITAQPFCERPVKYRNFTLRAD